MFDIIRFASNVSLNVCLCGMCRDLLTNQFIKISPSPSHIECAFVQRIKMTFPGMIACFRVSFVHFEIESEVVETAATMKYPHLTTKTTAATTAKA